MGVQDSLIGSVIDNRYSLTSLVGRGGMATVYQAHDNRLERNVAIKLMHTHLAEKPSLNTRFTKEARAAAKLTNPHVVAIHDQGVWNSPDGQRAYMVMEHVPGPDLRTELTRLSSFDLATSLHITQHILMALNSAHKANIVHRDIKPENILLSSQLSKESSNDDITAKVADFGLAHVIDGDSVETGTLLGTVAYIPPEAITQGEFEPQSDLYSLGIVLYEMLTGTLPFHGETAIQTAYKHVNDPMPYARDKKSWIPASIDNYIQHLTQKNPQLRPANAYEALQELQKIIASIPSLSSALTTPETAQHTALITTSTSLPPTQYQRKDTAPISYSPAPHSPQQSGTIAPSYATSVEAFQQPSPPTSTKKNDKKRFLLIAIAVLLLLIGSGTLWYFTGGPGNKVTLPSVVSLEKDKAAKIVEDAGFKVSFSEDYSTSIPANHVISTSPEAGQAYAKGTTVNLVISKGVENIEMPDIVGKTQDEAVTTLDNVGLKVEIIEDYSDDIEKGNAISQEPQAATLIARGSSVKIHISKGREELTVPNIVGKTREEAEQIIKERGFNVEIASDFSSSVTKGSIIKQEPSEGTAFRGDIITITESKGPDIVTVPDVTHMNSSEAQQKLKDAGLNPKVEYFFGDYSVIDNIMSQNPSAGTSVEKGSTVTITSS
ncbi:MAG: Stk1 family PASTA domain-containing Ser/Thr kinase [Actinomycetaceae bacterium]|nr:Stk1 family PASTA domain-containing Ser/Thr kinase [Actinomycetaceae bacterium]